jgi:putative heme-binding domain-containing protein
MVKLSQTLSCMLGLTLLASCSKYKPSQTADLAELTAYFSTEGIVSDSTGADSTELLITNFAGPDLVPSPSCLAVAATGEVFVGVDMIGSLGKTPGLGSIIKLVDSDHDGKMDSHTEFVKVDNPRGIIAMGDQVFVLHTTFGADSLATGMDLVVFEDKDQDGVADGPSKPLIKGISTQNQIQSRGTDHSTNGIRMGIDGWIYIAVGDFGFVDAEDREGTKLTMLGGGIVRVRPDGTEMEVYTHGTRNIYDVAIDPFMNVYTRGNTNDGGGWNIRFSHHLQSGEYGYPSLFKHFTDEILPALVDAGGGSGTGAYFMDDERWPAKYNRVPMMADWGKSQLYIHRVTMDGPSFKQQEENFIKLSQITDVDLDGSGQMYLAAWDGAGFRGHPDKGFVVRVVPVGYQYEAYPDLSAASMSELAELLKARNSVTRLDAQQEMLRRSKDEAAAAALPIAQDTSLPLDTRVAAIYTYAQAACGSGVDELIKLSEEDKIREFALRALTDRKGCLSGVPVDLFIAAAKDANPRVQTAAIIGLGRLGDLKATDVLLDVAVPASAKIPAKDTEGPHATPNSEIVLPHLAVRSLVQLNAVDATVKAIDSDNYKLALWTLRYMHDPKAVNALISAFEDTDNPEKKSEILTTLARLYQREAPYDGSWWWGTRPDTHGPYYKAENWSESEKVKNFLLTQADKADASRKLYFAALNDRHRLGIVELGTETAPPAVEEATIDLESIKNKKGQVGEASIEDVILAVGALKGDPALGKTLFTSQGCIACHAIEAGQVMKGPFMGQIGSIMNRDQIVESILKPNASISQGFASVQITTNDGKFFMGFVTAESADELTIRDITGSATKLEKKNIKERKELETSMMPSGLANSLSYEELASLVNFLSQQK